LFLSRQEEGERREWEGEGRTAEEDGEGVVEML